MSEIACTGLKASNPLGALAAFGLHRISASNPKLGAAYLHWTPTHGDWHPMLTTENACSKEELLELLAARPLGENRAEFLWRDEVKSLTRDEFTAFTAAHYSEPALLAWLAAFTAEPLSERTKATSPMDTTAAQWKLLSKLRDADTALYNQSTRKKSKADAAVVQLRFQRALFESWTYADFGDTLNWDPLTVANGAFSPQDPAKRKDNEKNCVLAAFWLAIESLPLFPCFWSGGSVSARGFRYDSGISLAWPVWETPISLPTLTSLLSIPELYKMTANSKDCAALRARGVTAVFASRRYNPSGYYGAFNHPRRIL